MRGADSIVANASPDAKDAALAISSWFVVVDAEVWWHIVWYM